MEESLSAYFKRFGVVYAPVEMMCPVGLQSVECRYDDRSCKNVQNDPGGYCAAWAFFFIQTALKFPDLWTDNITILVGRVLQKDPKAFHRFIINYSQFLYKNIELMIMQEKVDKLGPMPKMERRDLASLRGTREGLRESTIKATEKSLRKRTKKEEWKAFRKHMDRRHEKRKRDPWFHRKKVAKEFIDSQLQEGDVIEER
jgi:hypothetical protein